MQPWYNYCDFHRKQGWSCTSIQQLQETMCKIKTEFLLPFVRDGVKSQEYSLRPLCPVETVVKGFSCGHLSGRDIMILQLETESWELFISPNSSPRCAEHIKYHTSKEKEKKKIPNKQFTPHNYRSIHSFPTMTNRTVASLQSILNLFPWIDYILHLPVHWHLTFPRQGWTSSDKLLFLLHRML